jgi:hypothetical protein
VDFTLDDWAEPPPTEEGAPYREIRRPKAGGKVSGYVLSLRVWGGPVHFWQGHDFPHSKAVGRCMICQVANVPIRWKGYLECGTSPSAPRFLVELTSDAIRGQLDFHSSAPPLRGRLITVSRPGRSPQGRLIVSLEAGCPPECLPEPIDLARLMHRIWLSTGMPLPPVEGKKGQKNGED